MIQSPTNMSRKADCSGMSPVKGGRSRIAQGQPFVRHTSADSRNGVTSTQRKSGRKYETFVMTGDMIIRTTSGQNDSDSEVKTSVKNKQPPVDSALAGGEGSAKKKKIDHSKSKIPKPSGVNSPKVKHGPKESLSDSPKHSPKLQSPKVVHKVVHSPIQSPKMAAKSGSCDAVVEHFSESPKHKVKSGEMSPSLHARTSPAASPKNVSAMSQKGSKLPLKENTDLQDMEVTFIETMPSTIEPTETKEQNSQHKVIGYKGEENTDSKLLSQIPVSTSTHSEQMAFGYNNQAYMKQYLAEKRSPFDDIKKPVYHTCAAMPIALDIPPDDICSEDEQYTKISDYIDMEELPPPPAELLEDIDEKLGEPSTENIYEQNQSYFVPMYHNHFLEDGDSKNLLNSQQMSVPPPKDAEQKSVSTANTPSGEKSINYSSPIQPSTDTASVNSCVNGVYSDHRNWNTESELRNMTANTLQQHTVGAFVKSPNSSSGIGGDMSVGEMNSSNNDCHNKTTEWHPSHSAVSSVSSVLQNELPDKSNSIISPENTACSAGDKSSINSSRIPHFIKGHTASSSSSSTEPSEQRVKNQFEQSQKPKCLSNNNNNIDDSHTGLHNRDINTEGYSGGIRKKTPPITTQRESVDNQLDILETLLDNVLESQTPMDASFSAPTPPGEKDNSISDTSNTMVNKNAQSASHGVNGIGKLDYVFEETACTVKDDGGINNKECLDKMSDEPRRGMVVSISGENFGYKTFPSKSNQCHGLPKEATSNSGRNQSPATLVRGSKSHENYLDDNAMTMIDIDFEDNIASSVDALHYDQSCSSLDNVSKYSQVTKQSKSLDNSPEKRYLHCYD